MTVSGRCFTMSAAKTAPTALAIDSGSEKAARLLYSILTSCILHKSFGIREHLSQNRQWLRGKSGWNSPSSESSNCCAATGLLLRCRPLGAVCQAAGGDRPSSTDVLAAVGLVSVIDLVARRRVGRDDRLARALPGVLVGVVVGLQAMIALPYAPDFGAHHNHLLGGNRVAVNVIQIINQQEGLQVVARYLDGKPNTDSLDIGTTEAAFKGLGQVFSGRIRKKFSDKNDYHLLTLKDIQRRSELWTITQQIHGETSPEFLVIFDGVVYQQLYDARSPTPSQIIVVRRGGGTGFIVLAWVWTVALVFTLAWALRMEPEKR